MKFQREAASGPSLWKRIPRPVLLVVFLMVGLFHASTIRDGFWLGSDASLYLIHARNIAEGRPYTENTHISNPARTRNSPAAYPPVFPAMLAPAVAADGVQSPYLKLPGVLLIVGIAVLFFMLSRAALGDGLALAAAVLVGLLPDFWTLKDDILSDIPFVALAFLALWHFGTKHTPDRHRRAILSAVVSGVLIYLAYGTRSVGMGLVGCVALHDALRFRRLTVYTAVTLGVAVAAIAAQKLLLPEAGGYMDPTSGLVAADVLQRARGYSNGLGGLWLAIVPWRFRQLPWLVMAGLAAFGWVRRFRAGPQAVDLFALAYPVAPLLWRSTAGLRYLLPAVPLFLYYAFVGAKELGVALRRPVVGRVATALVLVLVTLSFARFYVRADYGPLAESLDDPPVAGFIEFLERQTVEGDVLVAGLSRLVALHSRRPAAVYDRSIPDADQWAWFESIAATMVIGRRASTPDRDYLYPFVERYPDRFTPVFGNEAFDAWRIADRQY